MPNWRPWFVNSSRFALIRRIRLRGATSRYRATWSRRDSPTRCANGNFATTRQGHGLVDPNGTAHALARTQHWRWYSCLPPCPIIPSARYLSFGKSDVSHGTISAFAPLPSDGPRLADLGREGPWAEGTKRSLPQVVFLGDGPHCPRRACQRQPPNAKRQPARLSQRGHKTGSLTGAAPHKQSWWPAF